jgi:DNA/RNA endonuclease YhcR with UshA esterase domain
MKSIRLLFTFLFLLTVSFCFTQKTLANVFAHNVRITQPGSEVPFDGNFADGTDAAIRFTLSDAADTVKVMIYDGSKNLIRTLTETNFAQGDTLVMWDGKDGIGNSVGTGTYSLSIYTSSAGYNNYTEIYYNGGNGLSTRGVTSIRSQSVKNFGFQYGIWSGIVRRYANDGQPWGDNKGSNVLTSPEPIPDRYSPKADSMGYIYFLGYSNHWVYRFNVDTLKVEIVDSSSIKSQAVGLSIKGKGNNAYLAVVANSDIFGMQLTGGTHYGSIDTLVNDPNYKFWDVAFGRGSMFYATYYSSDTSLPGVAAFDMSKYAGTPMKLSDADWKVIADSGRANTLAYDFASDPSKDIIYFTIARRFSGDANAMQNIYSISDLNGARSLSTVYVDKQNNMTQSRSDVAIDAAHNIILFENSDEENVLISPPTGYNSYLYTAPFSELKVFASEAISAVKVDANNDGMPDRLNDTVTVSGIVNSINFLQSSNGFSYFIQDATGGIDIYKAGATTPTFKIGDRIIATGKVAFYNGTTEISVNNLNTDIVLLDTNNTITPIVLTIEQYLADPEKYESMYIEIKGVSKTANSPAWPTTGNDANIMIWDGYKSITLRVDKDTDLDENPEPVYPIDVKGIATQYTSSAPYNTGYQISPNAFTDITAGVAVSPSPYFFFDPNLKQDAVSGLTISDSSEVDTVRWTPSIDLNGDAIRYAFKVYTPGGSQLLSVTSENSGADTLAIINGSDVLKNVLKGQDTVAVDLVILAKASNEVSAITSVDTIHTMIINNIVTGIKDKVVPHTFFVDQNYPNPFNPSTTIRFGLQKQGAVNLIVYNILGQQVAVLLNHQVMSPGMHEIQFNASRLASGTYIYRLQAGNNVVNKKMILLK